MIKTLFDINPLILFDSNIQFIHDADPPLPPSCSAGGQQLGDPLESVDSNRIGIISIDGITQLYITPTTILSKMAKPTRSDCSSDTILQPNQSTQTVQKNTGNMHTKPNKIYHTVFSIYCPVYNHNYNYARIIQLH